jgi:hypothetical protein
LSHLLSHLCDPLMLSFIRLLFSPAKLRTKTLSSSETQYSRNHWLLYLLRHHRYSKACSIPLIPSHLVHQTHSSVPIQTVVTNVFESSWSMLLNVPEENYRTGKWTPLVILFCLTDRPLHITCHTYCVFRGSLVLHTLQCLLQRFPNSLYSPPHQMPSSIYCMDHIFANIS